MLCAWTSVGAQCPLHLQQALAQALTRKAEQGGVRPLQNAKEQCGRLWAMLKAGAQATWKEWAGQRAAELTPALVVRL